MRIHVNAQHSLARLSLVDPNIRLMLKGHITDIREYSLSCAYSLPTKLNFAHTY